MGVKKTYPKQADRETCPCYLTEDNLSREKRNVKKAFSIYSEEYVLGSDETIRAVYEQEVIKITKPRNFMGIWQILLWPVYCKVLFFVPISVLAI